MARALKHRTASGGPFMTLFAVLLLSLPVLALGGWLIFTPEGRSSWIEARHQVATEAVAKP